jgi:hypothetical protein
MPIKKVIFALQKKQKTWTTTAFSGHTYLNPDYSDHLPIKFSIDTSKIN